MVQVTEYESHFKFGKNWDSYIKQYLNRDRIEEAKKSFREFVGPDAYKGKSFLDIGCGSGIFSLAALELGSSKIFSTDIDPDSTECTRVLKRNVGNPSSWIVENGSILDDDFVKKIGTWDIVYSWGVLHHTGDMWRAIKNSADMVAPGGYLHIAIYNKADSIGIYPDGRWGTSKFWAWEKKWYTGLPAWAQNVVDCIVMAGLVVLYLLRFQNPVRQIKDHIKYRGMSWRVDIKDWLGGYPYEYASAAEIFKFVKPLGFTLENLNTNNGLMNNEFLFKRN